MGELKWRCRGSLEVVAFAFILCLSASVSTASTDLRKETVQPVKQTLVIGKVSSNPKKHYRYLKPMADYVVKRMEDLGVREAAVLMARDNRQMVKYLKQGKVDWVTETVFSAVIFQEKAGAEPLLRKWKKGVPDYYSIFIARKDSGINALSDLKGKTIAFEDPGSTTAFFLPAIALIKDGLRLVELNSPRESSPTDAVGYVFAKQEINIATWVHKGLVDAGAYSNLDFNKEDHTPKAFRKDFNIFYRTDPFPRAIELVNKNMDPRIKARLKQLLLNADKDPRARSALRAYQKTTKFDELDENTLARLEEARQILKVVQSKVGE